MVPAVADVVVERSLQALTGEHGLPPQQFSVRKLNTSFIAP
ncbi:hypothetical protein GWL_28600 [Herbaspirillum sp. GW103]|nr:hypothetical protein GWL_28600 [Herbaspirillum sp. GW103]